MSINFIWDILKGFLSTAKDIIPIAGFLIFFQMVILKSPIQNVKGLLGGIFLSVVGLFLFIQGLRYGLLPLGEAVGQSLPRSSSLYVILIFAFFLGYTTTLAEPALSALAMEVDELSNGALRSAWLVHCVSFGVAIGITLGMLKIIYKIPSTNMIIPLLIITAILGYIAPERITGIAFDAAGVTTGPVTVPLNMALAIGLSTVLGGNDPLLDGFGIIALASLGPIITVLVLGIIIRF